MRHEQESLHPRPIRFEPDFLKYPDGSVQVSMGDTKVICTVMTELKVPPFAQKMGKGWITSEYSMLPGSTDTRSAREVQRGRPDGRTAEIQRLIGRSLRSITELRAIPERTLYIDCDVVQADGGTRTASINGAFVALNLAFLRYLQRGEIVRWPLREWMAAVSVGLIGEEILVDLNYQEDSKADVDLNLVVTSGGSIVEIQGTAEENPVPYETIEMMMKAGREGAREIMKAQQTVLKPFFDQLTDNLHKSIPQEYLAL